MVKELKHPSYLNIPIKEIDKRIQRAYHLFSPCQICPHHCLAKRNTGETGFCRSTDDIYISSYNAHFGEEPPLSGRFGSGTIFFTHCNLRCIYCQNYPISQMGNGYKITDMELAKIMLALQERKCHNVNLVTPTHLAYQILRSIKIAKEQGLHIPIVYNTSGYESVETLKLFDGIIDIYLPDARYSDNRIAVKYSSATNYFEVMKSALKEMHRQVGDLAVDKNGIAVSGLIVRHLILPGGLSGTKKIMNFISEKISRKTHISLMSQYFPAYKAKDDPVFSRKISQAEYKEAVLDFKNAGLVNGWFQED